MCMPSSPTREGGMDKTVNVRMFEVEAREGAMPFPKLSVKLPHAH